MGAGQSSVTCRASPAIARASKRYGRSVRACIDHGVEYLTLFAFSSENWRRPADEVSILMQLFMRALEQEVAKLDDNAIRFKVDRRHISFRTEDSRSDRCRRSRDCGQHAADLDRGRQLRRTLGHRAGGAEAARSRPERRAWTSRPRRSSRIFRWRTRRSPICSSAPAASNAFPIFCCGSSPTRRFYFTDLLWPDFDAAALDVRYRVVSAARASVRTY